jgi:uncharacterized damage-inducible protein DinB
MDPAYLLARWENVRAGLLATIEKLGDDDLSFMPYPGAQARLVELFDHIIEHEIHHRGELSLILGVLGREGLDA